MSLLKVILPAADIPLLSTVTKRTGDKPYTLQSELRVHIPGKPVYVVPAGEGCRFLVAGDGDANAIPGEHELCWHVEESYLFHFLADRRHDRAHREV